MTKNIQALYDRVHELLEPTKLCFQSICQRHLYFHFGFAALISIEVILLGLFLPVLIDAFFLGLGVSIIFFTSLLYCILRIYYNEKKPEELYTLRDEFLEECRTFISQKITPEELPSALSDCAYFAAEDFQKSSFDTIVLPQFFAWAQPKFNKLLQNTLRGDIEKITELFLFSSIEEEVRLVKEHPIKIETHGRLASLFMALADIYEANSSNAKEALLNAVEELKIITHLAPKNSAAHEALAQCFAKLHNGELELKQYELLYQLKPHDPTLLFQLGKRYLTKNETGKGLAIYEELKNQDLQKAQELLSFYGQEYTQKAHSTIV